MTAIEQLVETLQGRDGPMAAIDLADPLGCVDGGHETRRRWVRRVVRAARGKGHKICADGDGYWLARSHREWQDYLASRQSGARFEFVRVRDMREAATDRTNEQGRLFDQSAEPDRAMAWATER